VFTDCLKWTNGEGEADAAPNWAETVPAELDPVTGAARVVETLKEKLIAK
jgi:hypothetical protein